MIVKLLTEHHLKFLSLKRGCRGSSESTHVKYHTVGNLMHWLFNVDFLFNSRPNHQVATCGSFPFVVFSQVPQHYIDYWDRS